MKPDVHSKNFNAKCEFVILSKIDKDGNFSLLHGKPLTLELFNTIPDITVAFSEGESSLSAGAGPYWSRFLISA